SGRHLARGRTLPLVDWHRRRSCAGFWSVVVRSIASTRRCCCRCRRACARLVWFWRCRLCLIITMRFVCGWEARGGGGGRAGAGEWKLEVAPAGAVDAAACIRRIDIGGLDAGGREACICEHARAAESRLSPAAGEMVQAVWFDAGAQRSGRLLLTIHHLAVDG